MVLGRYAQNSLSTADGEMDRLMNKLNGMLQKAPCCGPLATYSESSETTLATIQESTITLDPTVVTPEDIAAAALSLRDGLLSQNDQLQARLDELQDVEEIRRENTRLTIELEINGAPDALDEVELWKKRYDAADSENSALRVTNSKIARALHDERVERMRADPKNTDLANNPCRGPGIVQKPHSQITTISEHARQLRSGEITEPPDIIFDNTSSKSITAKIHQLRDDGTPVKNE